MVVMPACACLRLQRSASPLPARLTATVCAPVFLCPSVRRLRFRQTAVLQRYVHAMWHKGLLRPRDRAEAALRRSGGHLEPGGGAVRPTHDPIPLRSHHQLGELVATITLLAHAPESLFLYRAF